jgi:hypothetical protein
VRPLFSCPKHQQQPCDTPGSDRSHAPRGMHLPTLCVIPDSGRGASRTALPRGAWERSSQASLLLQMDCGVPQVKIMPTLRVGMHLSTLCVILDSGRGAFRTALPRGAWERSSTEGLRRAVVCGVPQNYDRAHAPRGHASLDALRHPGQRKRSVQIGVTTRSVGTIINRRIAACRGVWCVVRPNILFVPTLRVGMHLSTLCVILDSGREASRSALPRGAWERSSQASLLLQMDCGVPQQWLWLLFPKGK